jgi:hypothetical protein
VPELRHRTTGSIIGVLPGNTLEEADLRGMRLENVNLFGQDLYYADMSGADLRGAELSNANLTGANLSGANLTGAELNGTNLTNANLTSADFRDTDLSGAQLTGTMLAGTNLTGAQLSMTLFAMCADLWKAVGLDKVRHVAQSSLDRYTVVNNVRDLPDVFLVGVGYVQQELAEYRRLYGPASPYYSCFISYRRTEASIQFVSQLYKDLTANSIRCWIDVHNMKGGTYYPTQLTLAIKDYDKVILVCSKSSLLRQNVVDEIITAMDRESETGQTKLFPIALDNFITGREILQIADEKMRRQEWNMDWVRRLRKYHIPDFKKWRSPHVYDEALRKLLIDLKRLA